MALQLITISPQRMIGPIEVHCMIEEAHTDALQITDHPVETGANISDHAYALPQELTLKAGWTNSSLAAAGDQSFVRRVYDKLLALQKSRALLDVTTGKRQYSNMLIRSLQVVTDQSTAAALFVTASLREVILTSTLAVRAPLLADQAEPQKTAGIANTGAKQLKAVGG